MFNVKHSFTRSFFYIAMLACKKMISHHLQIRPLKCNWICWPIHRPPISCTCFRESKENTYKNRKYSPKTKIHQNTFGFYKLQLPIGDFIKFVNYIDITHDSHKRLPIGKAQDPQRCNFDLPKELVGKKSHRGRLRRSSCGEFLSKKRLQWIPS